MDSKPVCSVLVTGVAGYIGSVLARQLLDDGIRVVGLDRLLFGDHSISELGADDRFEFVHGDVRHAKSYRSALDTVDAVVHLAAIVGDPACAQDPGLARETNLDASLQLLQTASDIGSVRRFVFASTCSNYGRRPLREYCSETSPLRPLSLYAETKVAVERAILASPPSPMATSCLRFATAYGLSRRMRFDLTVNEFAREVFLGRTLEIYGKQFWRPYCHTTDLARACRLVLGAGREQIGHAVFNVGSTAENYTKEHIAGMLREQRADADIRYVTKREDPRDYKVRCDRIRDTLGFVPTYALAAGVNEIFGALEDGRFSDVAEDRLCNTRAA